MDLLVINPGSTTTKVACFCDEFELWSETIEHDQERLNRFERIADQVEWREQAIADIVAERHVQERQITAVIGRGGLLRPAQGGTYRVTDAMCHDLQAARYGEHASNLGALLARRFGERFEAPAFVVDPVTTDEFEPASRLSGVPLIERKCRTHALNIKAVARRAATESEKPLAETAFVVAHLGGGISVCALRRGRIVDATDGMLGEGPFSLERAGTVPLAAMLELCFDSGRSKEEVVQLLSRDSGLKAYLGETRLPAVYEMARDNPTAREVLDALVLQIAKWIGAMTAVLHGDPDAILLTGGMSKSERFVEEVVSHVARLAPVRVYPGELEMTALALGLVRVVAGDEAALEY
jgi:butyrate kinase